MFQTKQHRVRTLLALLLLFTATPTGLLTTAAAQDAAAETEPVIKAADSKINYSTTPEMRTEVLATAFCLENLHLQKKPVNSLNNKAIIKDYLSNLDTTRLFFLAPDVQGYQERFAPMLDIYFSRGNITPAFSIYKDFLEKFDDRLAWIEKRLQQPFNLNTSATFTPDRGKADWPQNKTEADKLWEQRLTLDLILEILGDGKKNVAVTPERTAAAVERIRKRYNKIKTRFRFEAHEVAEIYLNILTAQYDPHTTFFSKQSREDFEIAMRNKLIGVGAMLRDEEGYCVVKEILPGGPIEASNRVRPGDRIIAIGQGENGDLVDIIGMRLHKIVSQLRGLENTTVRLRIEPASDRAARYTLTLKRAEIKLTTKLATATLFSLPVNNNGNKTIPVGLIDLPAFYGKSEGDKNSFSTTENVAELITKLKKAGVQGIVLDLRRNGGGLLDEAVRLAGLFIPAGQPVLQVRTSGGQVEHYDTPPSPSGVLWDGPLVILVSKISASASEIVAGALQDHHRAIVLGDEHTHGKGSVQTLLELSRFSKTLGSAAKFTVQKWYLPSGKSIQLKGVEADIPAPSIYSVLPVAESDLENPLAWDTIGSALDSTTSTARATTHGNLIKVLREKSKKRQETLPEFNNLNRIIAWTKIRAKSRTFPLNYDLLKKEREEDKTLRTSVRKTYKALDSERFKAEVIKLDDALKQEREESKTSPQTNKENEKTPTATSQKNKDTAEDENEEEEDDEEDDYKEDEKNSIGKKNTNFDVQRRESLRVLGDWIALLQSPSVK